MRELIFPGQLAGHKAIVIGAGLSGLAAARLLSRLGAEITVLDKKADAFSLEIQEEAEQKNWQLKSGEHQAEDFAWANLIIPSPGVPISSLAALFPPKVQIVSEVELASWFISEPIIAVTGTNGKTTTVSMLSHILSSCGFSVFTGGNIGTPLSNYVLDYKPADVLILELSSFQLQNISSFHPKVGILLNFSANHLDYHADLQEYFEAKLNLFRRMNAQDLAILPLELKQEIESRDFFKCKITYFIPSNRFADTNLLGEHNQANMEAAYLACRYLGVSEEQVQHALQNFNSIEHRLEQFLQTEGISFINDSKATTVTAMQAALNSVDGPIRLLAGGVFKGGDLKALQDILRQKVSKVYLFGGSREIFESAWKGICPLSYSPDLEGAVLTASKDILSGETMLLSPATSSFDLFSSYKQRGLVFKELVQKIWKQHAAK